MNVVKRNGGIFYFISFFTQMYRQVKRKGIHKHISVWIRSTIFWSIWQGLAVLRSLGLSTLKLPIFLLGLGWLSTDLFGSGPTLNRVDSGQLKKSDSLASIVERRWFD